MADPSASSTDDTNDLVVAHSALSKQEYVDLVIWNWLVTCLYCYKSTNHILAAIIGRGRNTVELLDAIVDRLRDSSCVSDIVARYTNHLEENNTYALSANGVNEADIDVITALVNQSIDDQLQWWSSFTDVTLYDIMHQQLSINRSYQDENITYNQSNYYSKAIPARYNSWQAWVITTRWNNNAERTHTPCLNIPQNLT
jgi:hypothetical protein